MKIKVFPRAEYVATSSQGEHFLSVYKPVFDAYWERWWALHFWLLAKDHLFIGFLLMHNFWAQTTIWMIAQFVVIGVFLVAGPPLSAFESIVTIVIATCELSSVILAILSCYVTGIDVESIMLVLNATAAGVAMVFDCYVKLVMLVSIITVAIVSCSQHKQHAASASLAQGCHDVPNPVAKTANLNVDYESCSDWIYEQSSGKHTLRTASKVVNWLPTGNSEPDARQDALILGINVLAAKEVVTRKNGSDTTEADKFMHPSIHAPCDNVMVPDGVECNETVPEGGVGHELNASGTNAASRFQAELGTRHRSQGTHDVGTWIAKLNPKTEKIYYVNDVTHERVSRLPSVHNNTIRRVRAANAVINIAKQTPRTAEYKRAFGLYDKEGSGRVHVHDLKSILQALSEGATQKQLAALVSQFAHGTAGFLELYAPCHSHHEYCALDVPRCMRLHAATCAACTLTACPCVRVQRRVFDVDGRANVMEGESRREAQPRLLVQHKNQGADVDKPTRPRPVQAERGRPKLAEPTQGARTGAR